MNETLINIVIIFLKIVIVMGAVLVTVAYLTLAERRVSAFIQDRLGPNRVGPFGLLQPMADGIKFFLKEDIIPDEADKPIYIMAPVTLLITALITFAVIPFGESIVLFDRTIKLQIADLNIGVLYVFAVLSMGIYGIVLGGWASGSKYSMLGGLRSAAQLISYELSLGLSIVGVLMIAGSLRLDHIVSLQTETMLGFLPAWNVLLQPVGFLIFIISAFAETNRVPFDLTEAEQELVGGYHTEYSSMKFAMYFLAEYANMITASALIVTLFFGGWHIPWLNLSGINPILVALLKVISFCIKVGFFLFLFLWIRWTLPRFRYDQLMRLGWKVLLPLSILNIVVTGLVLSFI